MCSCDWGLGWTGKLFNQLLYSCACIQDSCHLINNLVLGEFDGIYEKEEMDCIIHQLAEQSETDLSINLWKTFTDVSYMCSSSYKL